MERPSVLHILALCVIWGTAFICRADIAIPGVSQDSGLTAAEKKALLDEHNYLRSQQAQGLIPGQPPAADMTHLVREKRIGSFHNSMRSEQYSEIKWPFLG